MKSVFTLINVWRKLHPNQRQFTWFNSTSTNASRLDKSLVSKDFLSSETKCDIFPCSFSDYDFAFLVFDFPCSIEHGPGVWNFNNSLLKEKDFCIAIDNLIDDHIRFLHAFVSIQDWWEFLKRSVRKEAISFSRKKWRRLHRDEVFLTDKLIRLRQRLVYGDTAVSDSISNTESRLITLRTKKAERIMIRCRAKWLEEGQRPSRYFLIYSEEKCKDRTSLQCTIQTATRSSLKRKLRKCTWNFILDSFPKSRKMSRCKPASSRQLTSDQASSCKGDLTLEEITVALNKINTNKAPGPDGLSVEFYSKFWDRLGPYLCQGFNACSRAGEMFESMKTSTTLVIFKKGDRKDLKNW